MIFKETLGHFHHFLLLFLSLANTNFHTHTWVSSFKAFSGDWPVSWMQFTTWHDREAHSETISVKVYGHANQRHDAPLWPLQGLHIQC